jgi:Taurine catabolism dioxygenase TauD, TfdA family
MSDTALHSQTGGAPKRLPIGGPAAWTGAEMARSDVWQRTLSTTAIAEIEAALAGVKARGLAWHEITKADFPLPTFAEELAEVGRLLEDGPGLMRLRGLPVERWDEAGRRSVFFGLGTHLGTARTQTVKGELMAAITDEDDRSKRGEVKGQDGATFLSSRGRVQSTGQLRYHTDRVDVVGLLCVNKAAKGGLSKVASAVAIHDAMLMRRPDLLELLFQDYHRSRFGEEDLGNKAYYALPVFALCGAHFTTHYSRTYIEAAELNPELPNLTPAQWQAIDLMAELAEELCLTMTLAPGDMQFLNNHVMFHARTAYEDDAGHLSPRLLYRLWLSVPNSRPLPESHAVLFGDTRAGALRGGIKPSVS